MLINKKKLTKLTKSCFFLAIFFLVPLLFTSPPSLQFTPLNLLTTERGKLPPQKKNTWREGVKRGRDLEDAKTPQPHIQSSKPIA